MSATQKQYTPGELQKQARALALFSHGITLSKLHFSGADDGGCWAPDEYGDLTPDQCRQLLLFLQDIGGGDSETGSYTLFDVAASAWEHLFPSEVPGAVVAPLPLVLSARDGAIVMSGMYIAKGDGATANDWRDIRTEWDALIPHRKPGALSGKEAQS